MSNNFNDFFGNIIDKPLVILFAHEEKQIVNLFFEMLKDLVNANKIKLDSAQSGYEIIDKNKNNSYDLIIIDEELPSFNIPEVLHKIKMRNPQAKIIVLAKVFNDSFNEIGRIQFCKKPFRFNDLRQTIVDVCIKHSLALKNYTPLDILITLSVISRKTVVTIQNLDNNRSGEIFIHNRKVVQATVEGDNISLHSEKAVYEVLKWPNFEGCVSKGTPFPEEDDYAVAVEISNLAAAGPDSQKQQETGVIELSEEAREQLQGYLSQVPYYLDDNFVMNAFCSSGCDTHVSIKDPDYSELLYKMGDTIVEKFIAGSRKINAKGIAQGILTLSEEFVMAIHKLDQEIWYYSILKSDDNLDALDSIVCDFSYDALSILSDFKKKSVEDFMKEVA